MKTFKMRIQNVYMLDNNTTQAECNELESKKFKDTYAIKVSTRKNISLLKYLVSIIHELLHVALYIINKVFKWEVDTVSEHEFIGRVEDAVNANFYLLKRKKKKRKKK